MTIEEFKKAIDEIASRAESTGSPIRIAARNCYAGIFMSGRVKINFNPADNTIEIVEEDEDEN